LRAKGSNQEGILISSESRMDFEGGVAVLDVKTGAGGIVFIGFAVSKTSTLATLGEDDDVAPSEAGGEFVEPDCGAGIWFGATAGLDGTDWGTRGELEIVGFVSG
jgi:hypothetical protein